MNFAKNAPLQPVQISVYRALPADTAGFQACKSRYTIGPSSALRAGFAGCALHAAAAAVPIRYIVGADAHIGPFKFQFIVLFENLL